MPLPTLFCTGTCHNIFIHIHKVIYILYIYIFMGIYKIYINII